MSDKALRELERQASQGDVDAENRAKRSRCRAGHCACMDAIRAARWVVTATERRTIPVATMDGQSLGAVQLPVTMRVVYQLVGSDDEVRKVAAAIDEAVRNA